MFLGLLKIFSLSSLFVGAMFIFDAVSDPVHFEVVIAQDKYAKKCGNENEKVCYSINVIGEHEHTKPINKEIYETVEKGSSLKVNLSMFLGQWMSVTVLNDRTSKEIMWTGKPKLMVSVAMLFLCMPAVYYFWRVGITKYPFIVVPPIVVFGCLSLMMILRFILVTLGFMPYI